MSQLLKRNFLWIIYGVFVLLVILNHEGEHVYCSSKESFFSTLKKLYPLHWAKQIGLDLYLGLILSLSVIYLNEGSILVLLVWIIPVMIYANLAILLYVALNYDSIISHFL